MSVAGLIGPLSSTHAASGDGIDVSKIHNRVHISLGQKIAIIFDQRGDQLVNPRRVRSTQKDSMVTLEFSADDKKKARRTLWGKSSYPRIVRYRAAYRLKGLRNFVETDMIPLNPNIPVRERWMDGPVDELVLFDFRLTNEKPPKSA